MSKKNIYVATIKIALTAECEDEAFERVSVSLSENLKEHGAIIDWGYTTPANPFENFGEYKEEEYLEGDAITGRPDYIKQVKEALVEGKKLLAVKIYKDATGAGLKESKEFVDILCPEFLKKDDDNYRSGFHTDANGDLLHTF